MSASPSTMPPTQLIDGIPIPCLLSAEDVRSVINYKPRDDDIFIVTYPKCGTTWSLYTLTLVLRHGQPFCEDFNILGSTLQNIEMTGIEATKTMQRPAALKTHLPFHLVPWSNKAKYIYVTRNPKDACVSFFHHMRNIPALGYTGEFDEFFEHFLSGDINFGDYFDHLMGWYEHRNDSNVMFLSYEEMKENQEAAILKMASFVDDEKFAEPLRKDRQIMEQVLKYSSFKEMKLTINDSLDALSSMSAEDVKKSDMPEKIKMLCKNKDEKKVLSKPKSINFVRKGIVGDWRNHFSEEQSRRLDEKFAKRTQGTEIANWWKEYM